MLNFEQYTPTRVLFGKEIESRPGEAVKALGAEHILLVYGGGSVVKSGLLGRIEDSLKAAGIAYEEFGGAQPNPTLAHAVEGVEKGKAMQADFVLAVGGGSAIDTAKGIAVGIANPDTDLWEMWTGAAPINAVLPIGVVLTLAAAGSEMSAAAVLTNEDLHLKRGVPVNDRLRPQFTVMNPELLATVPKYHLIAGVVDIMMHTLDRYFVTGSPTRLTDEIAEGLLRTVIDNAPLILADPNDYDAMAEIMWSSSISHNGMTELGKGPRDFAVHGIAAPLSARYDATHGATLSATWGAWATYVWESAPDRFARYARKVWGVEAADDAEAAKQGIEKTVAFFRSIEAPVTITELLGKTLTEDECGQLAADVVGAGKTISRVRPLATEDVKKILVAAL